MAKILVIEDEANIRNNLIELLGLEGFETQAAVDGLQGIQLARTWRPDLIISDIAPNITGIASADQASSIYFLELALDTVLKTLKPGATFVAKMFQGAGSDEYLKQLRAHFEKVLIRKPAASRKESREVYLVARGFKG